MLHRVWALTLPARLSIHLRLAGGESVIVNSHHIDCSKKPTPRLMNTPNPVTQRKLVGDQTREPRSGALAPANLGFHETYTRLLEQALAQLGGKLPVLVLIGDDLTLLCDDRRQSERVVPERYHQLKACCHLAFGAQLSLMANGSGPLSQAAINELRRAQAQIPPAQSAAQELCDGASAAPHPSAPHVKLLKQTGALLEQVLADGRVDLDQLQPSIRDIAALALQTARLAVRLELDRLHQVVQAWRRDLGQRWWADAHVVVCGNHQPRYREAACQYFARLLQETQGAAAEREDRLLYGEGIIEIDAALDLLARHRVDQQASLLLFGDRRRLQQDVLADAATQYVEELFAAPNERM